MATGGAQGVLLENLEQHCPLVPGSAGRWGIPPPRLKSRQNLLALQGQLFESQEGGRSPPAGKDASYIREQLSLYAPDIIICCGWWVVADILYQDVLPKDALGPWRKTGGGFDYFRARLGGKEIPVVSFYHPQRIASHAVFEGWYDHMREIGGELLPGKSISV